MRDPKRIKRICQLLENTWNRYPELRLGQLLINFVFGTQGRDSHIYFKEDDEIEANLDKLIKDFDKKINNRQMGFDQNEN